MTLSAGALSLAQPPLSLWWLAPFALVPWLAALRGAGRLRAAGTGALFGTLYGLVSAHWIPGALGALGAGAVAATTGWGLIAVWGAGVPWALVGAAAGSAGAASPLGFSIRFAAAVFLVETLRSTLPFALPWTLLGHTQTGLPGVTQVAVAGGVPAISAVLAATNAGLSELAGRRPSRATALPVAAGALGAYLAVLIGGLPAVEWARGAEPAARESSFQILAVQPNIPAHERWVRSVQRINLAIVARQTEEALRQAAARPDLVVWPETVVTSPLDADETLERDLRAWVDRLGTPIVLGAAHASDRAGPAAYRNSALWLTPGTAAPVARFDKERSIPVIESGSAFPGQGLLARAMGLTRLGRFVEDAGSNALFQDGSDSFAVALCFEALFPALVGERRGPDTRAILNLANDSWFVDRTPSAQQVAFASFRAVEQRLWLVRVAHGGISAVVDPYGRIVVELPFGSKGTLAATLAPSPPPKAAERAAVAGLLAAGGCSGAWGGGLWTRRRMT